MRDTSFKPLPGTPSRILKSSCGWRARMTERGRLGDAPPISPERVAAFRLTRHHLARRAPASALARVAGDIAGAQAQISSAAQLSLWARTTGLRPEGVERALWRDRTLAKVWCMRGTVHLVPADALAVFARGSTGRVDRDTHWLETHGYPASLIDRVLDALAEALDRPRTRTDLAETLAKTLGASAHRKSGRGWGAPRTAPGITIGAKTFPIGYLVFLACYRGLACAGPPVNGNEATFVRPDVWLPRWRDAPLEDAETELVRRYLRAFGPATVKDFVMWCGVTATRARAMWARLAGELTPVRVEGETAWILQEDLGTLRRAKVAPPNVRLLPYFDSFLMGHGTRTHLIDAARHKQVYRPAGWVSPVVLLDGRVAGIWSTETKGDRTAVTIHPFQRFSREVKEGIDTEVERLGRFLDTTAAWRERSAK